MITSVSESFLKSNKPRPELHNISEFGLKVQSANGDILPCTGYIEAVPFCQIILSIYPCWLFLIQSIKLNFQQLLAQMLYVSVKIRFQVFKCLANCFR